MVEVGLKERRLAACELDGTERPTSCIVRCRGEFGIGGIKKVVRLGDGVPPNSDRRGVDGTDDGGSGNLDKPMLIVLSALPDALVSMDLVETWPCFGFSKFESDIT